MNDELIHVDCILSPGRHDLRVAEKGAELYPRDFNVPEHRKEYEALLKAC